MRTTYQATVISGDLMATRILVTYATYDTIRTITTGTVLERVTPYPSRHLQRLLGDQVPTLDAIRCHLNSKLPSGAFVLPKDHQVLLSADAKHRQIERKLHCILSFLVFCKPTVSSTFINVLTKYG